MKEISIKLNKKVLITIGKAVVLGAGFLFLSKAFPMLLRALGGLADLFKLIDGSPELKFLMVCLSIWINIIFIKFIIHIFLKAHDLLEHYEKKGKKKK